MSFSPSLGLWSCPAVAKRCKKGGFSIAKVGYFWGANQWTPGVESLNITSRINPPTDPHPFLQVAVMAATPNQSPRGVPENAADWGGEICKVHGT